MSNEEQTQIFRGDDMPPEIGIAETGGPVQRRRPAAPSDQRSLHDQSNGPSDTHQLHDSRDELADLRKLHDTSGAAESRQMDDATDGPSDARSLQDADGVIDAQHAHDGHGPSDQRSISDAQGLVDTNHAHDGDGPSQQRSMTDAQGLAETNPAHDAQGPSDQRSMNDAEGPSLQRQVEDASHGAAAPQQQAHSFHDDDVPEPEADAGMVTLNSAGEVVAPDPAEDTATVQAEAPIPDADLTFKVEEDATPWALSIHLEARIASLTESTAKVNEQLGGLEDSIKRLAKRIGK